MSLYLPENYDPHMTVRETQDAIKYIRDLFPLRDTPPADNRR